MSHKPVRTLRIACLGWGSLVWDPRALPIQREWFKDGPFAAVEFTRQSSDGRMTLVIDPRATPTRLLWAQILPLELSVAKEALRDREGIVGTDWLSRIGSWQGGDSAPAHVPDLPNGPAPRVWTRLFGQR